MDADRFDSLTTRLSDHLTRRRGLLSLAALGLGLGGVPTDTDARGRRRRRRRNGRGNGGKNDGGNLPPPPPPPAPECTADTGCNESLGEVCRDTQCQCPGGMVRDQDRYCVCPFGTVWCNGACREQECCSFADCRGNAQCISGQCVCADPCCQDTDCPGSDTCVDGVCEECPGCEVCAFGVRRYECTRRTGTACCKRVFCPAEPGDWGYHHGVNSDCQDCLPYVGTMSVGPTCNDDSQCNSDADCAGDDECHYVSCCNKSFCIPPPSGEIIINP